MLAAIERAAPRYARLALRARGTGLPPSVSAFPAKLAPYLGAPSDNEHRARLVEARLVFLLARAVVTHTLDIHGTEESRHRLGPIEVRGEPHLDAALAEERGVILVSAHFGLPSLIRLILEARGLRVIGVGAREAERVDVVVGGDVWAAARGMQQLRAALAERQVCVLLVDTPRGPYAEPPFLYGRIPVAAGAFRLAQLSRSPLLPVFALHTGGGRDSAWRSGHRSPSPIARAHRRLPTASPRSCRATRRSPGATRVTSSPSTRSSTPGVCRNTHGDDEVSEFSRRHTGPLAGSAGMRARGAGGVVAWEPGALEGRRP